jgi:hypothetical protein
LRKKKKTEENSWLTLEDWIMKIVQSKGLIWLLKKDQQPINLNLSNSNSKKIFNQMLIFKEYNQEKCLGLSKIVHKLSLLLLQLREKRLF